MATKLRKDRFANWRGATAPSLDDFEALANEAFESLPGMFRDRIGGVPIMVADFPDDDVLAEMEIDSPFELMGLFEGVGLTDMGLGPETGQMPNRIWLYRRPILDYWCDADNQTLGQIIVHVLVHEIGHHFGFSDADMEALEAQAAAEE